jgi:uncharacterized protein (TIGR00251 family)
MIAVTEHAEGCVLAVRAQPGAKRNGVVGEQNDALKVAVTAPADEGRANKALVEVLAEALGVRKSQVELIVGTKSRDKKFLVRAVSPDELRARLTRLTGSTPP